MNIVVDTNIVFSAILNADGTIADLLLNSDETFKFYAPNFMLEELEKHHEKMKSISGLSEQELRFLESFILKKIEIISEDFIDHNNWNIAKRLTEDVDEFDIPFVALSIELECPLWTGDKKLMRGIAKDDDVDWIYDTQKLIRLR